MTTNRLLVSALLLGALLSAQSQPTKETTEPTEPKKPGALRIALSGMYLDLPEMGTSLAGLLMGGPSQPKPFYELTAKLEKLAQGDKAQPILLDLTQSPSLNQPQLSELERVFAKLRASGRKTYAYLEGASVVEYQIASLCDVVLMADMGSLDFRSLALSVTFMKDAFDLLGVSFDVVRCGEFKGAVEPFMLPAMSDHLRAHYRAMVESMNDDLVRRVAERRGLSKEQVRKLQGDRLIPAKEALAMRLVDKLVPWQGAERALKDELGVADLELENAVGGAKKRQSFDFFSFLAELMNPKTEKKVGKDTLVVLHLSGEIVDGDRAMPGRMVSGPCVKQIDALAQSEHVKGVVVRVNSPGGSATASEAILLALRRLAEKKPVVVSMGNVAGSGGYYITCIGRPILAEPGTITGSIGVFGMRPCLGPLMRRVGVRNEIVALDESAGMDSIDRGWTDAERTRMQGFVDDVYARFVAHVARSRKLAKDEVLKIAGGRVWSGRQAVANKLVDRIGGLQDALDMVAKEASFDASKFTHLPQPKSPLDSIVAMLNDDEASTLLEGALTRLGVKRLAGLGPVLALLRDALENDAPARVWALMPAELRLR